MFHRKRLAEADEGEATASTDADALDYFCYVSRNKVDQLYAQLDPEVDYDLTETRTKEHTVTADAHADWSILHVVKLFKAGGTYGRKGVIQREAKVKQTYMSKLGLSASPSRGKGRSPRPRSSRRSAPHDRAITRGCSASVSR